MTSCAKTPHEETDNAEIYIPVDLEDCFRTLDEILKPGDIRKIKRTREKNLFKLHFGLGMWMRNAWELWGDSHLATWFHEMDIYHPDNMSSIIIRSYWRYLNDKPIELERQINWYRENRVPPRVDTQ